MADPPTQEPPSPVSILLQGLGLTRDDLQRHAAQMKNFLETEDTYRAASSQNDTAGPSGSKTRPVGRSRSGSVSNNSTHPPRATSPQTNHDLPEKAPRQMDTMEIIMERKDRQRKERRASGNRTKETRRAPQPEVTTPTTPKQPPPGTPHHYRYYSERVIEEATSSKNTPDAFRFTSSAFETPTKTPQPRPIFKAPQTPSKFPKTPTPRHVYTHEPSSPRASSPPSSPAGIVNLVSSPGPMRIIASLDDGPDDLPFTLPPGPYSREKPDYSYAAIIGQAILSSPQHRLTLQDIYEWITTVYPYYQRGEQTWMNSIRHALSTMAVFRKVPRQRMEGKSLWAVWDEDLPCFANGGFRKSLCADMMKHKADSQKPGPKKRGAIEEGPSRGSKRRRTSISSSSRDAQGNLFPSMLPAPVFQPFYSHILPGTHHQPYYGTYMAPQPVPPELLYPSFAPHLNYPYPAGINPFISTNPTPDHLAPTNFEAALPTFQPSTPILPPSSQETTSSVSEPSPPPSSVPPPSIPPSSAPPSSDPPAPPLTFPSFSAPLSSTMPPAPELTPDGGSSSSPPLPDVEAGLTDIERSIAELLSLPRIPMDPIIADPDDEFERWLASEPVEDAVAPLVTLLRGFSENKMAPAPSTKPPSTVGRKVSAKILPPPPPPSIAPERRSVGKGKAPAKRSPSPPQLLRRVSTSKEKIRPTTPPPPRTPPRKRSTNTSPLFTPQRTPATATRSHTLSSPTPPRRLDDILGLPVMPSPELMRTPSRKRTTPVNATGSGSKKSPSSFWNMSPFGSTSPKKLLFGGAEYGSPYRTPSSTSRPLFDPHDPAALLDEELMRLGCQFETQGSPSGLFGKSGKGLLYESPGIPSPGSLERYWLRTTP